MHVRMRRLVAVGASLTLLSLSLGVAAPALAAGKGPLGNFKHIVVIYEENHSFDNLYGAVGRRQRPTRRSGSTTPTPPTRRRSPRTASPYTCLQADST